MAVCVKFLPSVLFSTAYCKWSSSLFVVQFNNTLLFSILPENDIISVCKGFPQLITFKVSIEVTSEKEQFAFVILVEVLATTTLYLAPLSDWPAPNVR